MKNQIKNERAYETEAGLHHYRFDGRFLSGYPRNLQALEFGAWGKWVDCPNISIANKIQNEIICKKNHHWSRLTLNSNHCKTCGIIIKID